MYTVSWGGPTYSVDGLHAISHTEYAALNRIREAEQEVNIWPLWGLLDPWPQAACDLQAQLWSDSHVTVREQTHLHVSGNIEVQFD